MFGAGQVLAVRGPVDARQLRLALASTAPADQATGYRVGVRAVALADGRYDVVVSHALSSVHGDLAVLRRVLAGAVPVGVLLRSSGWSAAEGVSRRSPCAWQTRQFIGRCLHESGHALGHVSRGSSLHNRGATKGVPDAPSMIIETKRLAGS